MGADWLKQPSKTHNIVTATAQIMNESKMSNVFHIHLIKYFYNSNTVLHFLFFCINSITSEGLMCTPLLCLTKAFSPFEQEVELFSRGFYMT